MFVKVKLEDHSEAPHIFNMEDKATIEELKIRLDPIVKISADKQEIKTLHRTLNNCEELHEVVNQDICGENINGAAISLYTDNKFFCFLQFYNQSEGDKQTNFFNQPLEARKLPIDKMPKYCENIIDSDESWHSSSSESDSADNSSSSASSEDTRSPKRKSIAKHNSSIKRVCTLESNGDWRCCPSILAAPVSKVTVIPDDKQESNEVLALPRKDTKQITVVDRETEKNSMVDVAPHSSVLQEIVNCSAEKELTKEQEGLPTAPYITMKPEHRRYALVISHVIAEQHLDFGNLMMHFYDLFESSQNCGRLNFSEYASISTYDDKLWVFCEDSDTCDWITAGVRTMNLYKSYSFIQYFSLLKCSMVLPQVVDGKELADIFNLLKQQNLGLNTDKWCIVERSTLDAKSEEFSSKAVTSLFKNEKLVLYVDRESKSYIQDHGSKLKYCFWKLYFEF